MCLPFAESSNKAATGGQRAEDPDFALHQTSPTLAREGCLQVSAPPADALGRTVNLRRLGLVRPQNYHILRNLDYGGLCREVVPSAQRVYAAASRFVLSTNGAPCVRLIWRSVWGQRARELAGRQAVSEAPHWRPGHREQPALMFPESCRSPIIDLRIHHC